DRYRALALAQTLRDRLMVHWKNTHAAYYQADCRRAYYLSLEFLMGRAMGNAIINLDCLQVIKEAVSAVGVKLEDLIEQEQDAGLGNGGLGRLAACFLDSCATLQLPVMGYGIRYEYGMFRQLIENGYQVEEPDHWLVHGSPWEMIRPEYAQLVPFKGHSEFFHDTQGRLRVRWANTEDVVAMPYDVPIPGYNNGTVNTLRLWKAQATEVFGLHDFNKGDYTTAVRTKNEAENISMVLYPNDQSENGKELRLRQQYFLASASLQDILRRWTSVHGEDFSNFADKNAFQLNDTHPTVAVAELMRLLMDEHALTWDAAWAITTKTMAYTNHTLLPEALEKWPLALFKQLLPRPLEIIMEINARFMRTVANKWPADGARQARMSIIEDGPQPQIRMAYLGIVGSFSVNGVAELHSRLIQEGLFNDFFQLWPEKFNNKTNGVTQRRWLAWCNPGLTELLNKEIGKEWVTDLSQMRKLEAKVDNAAFRKRWIAVKLANKQRLAELVEQDCGVHFDTAAMFDVQVKRIHEYKRQLLNILHVIHLYHRIKNGDTANWTKRCVLIGGKAAPGYAMAKSIIKLCTGVADVVNNDPDVGDLLKVAFLPNYRVSTMEIIAPGTDLSEQISTAGKEASGTGNMKFMMNGALTIGTLDGANIEMREEVGEDHFFLFGLTSDEVVALRANYNPQKATQDSPELAQVLDLLRSGHFNQCEPGIFDNIINALTEWGDYWMVCADFASYVKAQEAAAALYRNQEAWVRSAILNSAACGKFSTDRTMQDYNRDIWKLSPIAPK
ncbi:MAG: glycogen/starch/alpha-glucan phosphorylase, partial [Planctomycetota bacterium]